MHAWTLKSADAWPEPPRWLVHATCAAALTAIAAPGLIATDGKREFADVLRITDAHVTEHAGAQRPQGPPPWGDPDQLSPETENGTHFESPFQDTRTADRSAFRERFER